MDFKMDPFQLVGLLVVCICVCSCCSSSTSSFSRKESFTTRDKDRKDRFSVKIGDAEYEFKPPRVFQ